MRSPNDEGSQFSKLHFPCNKEERLVLNSFFREYNLYLTKKKKNLNLFKVAYHPVSCLLHLHTHINADKEINNKDSKFKVGDHVRIPKYKNIFAKGYMPNWSKEVFGI